MKKVILSMAMMVLAANLGYSQITSKLGVGLSLTNLSEDPEGGASANPGFLFGSSLVFGDHLYFEPGIYYTVKSTEIASSGSTPDKFDADIKGLRVPLSVGLNLLGEESAVGIRAFGGGSVFFVTGTGDDIDKDAIESPSWGAHLGAGLDLSIFYLDLVYEWSLTNVQKDIDLIDFGKHRSFYITAGIWLNKNK